MSDTLIKRSWAVIMTHLSAAPDPDSYSRTSIRGCICLWVSITALIPGGIWHIFQWGAIRTPAEAASRRTTCGEMDQMERKTLPCSTHEKRCGVYWTLQQEKKMPEMQQTPAKKEAAPLENSGATTGGDARRQRLGQLENSLHPGFKTRGNKC